MDSEDEIDVFYLLKSRSKSENEVGSPPFLYKPLKARATATLPVMGR